MDSKSMTGEIQQPGSSPDAADKGELRTQAEVARKLDPLTTSQARLAACAALTASRPAVWDPARGRHQAAERVPGHRAGETAGRHRAAEPPSPVASLDARRADSRRSGDAMGELTAWKPSGIEGRDN